MRCKDEGREVQRPGQEKFMRERQSDEPTAHLAPRRQLRESGQRDDVSHDSLDHEAIGDSPLRTIFTNSLVRSASSAYILSKPFASRLHKTPSLSTATEAFLGVSESMLKSPATVPATIVSWINSRWSWYSYVARSDPISIRYKASAGSP